MSRILYFDCFNGASGDMVLGALLDAGLPLDDLRRALGSLAVDAAVSATRVLRAGVSATKFIVEEQPEQRARTWSRSHAYPWVGSCRAPSHPSQPRGNQPVIERSALSSAAQARAKELFHRLGEAEAAIHQMPIDRIHLHEVGALDSIIDIVGAVFALEWFGCRSHHQLAVECRRWHGAVGARSFSGSGAGDRQAAGWSACVLLRHPERARDANRRVARDRLCRVLRPGPGDDCRACGLRRRRSRPAEHAERPSHPCRREHRPTRHGADCRRRM